jgi:hypothetical protein
MDSSWDFPMAWANKNVFKIVDNEVLIYYRLSCLEMDKSELDLIIKVQLFAHRNNSTGVDAKKTQRQRKRENNATIFFQWSPDM